MEYKIDHKNPIPLHIQAEKLLRSIIDHPDYATTGKFLPNEVDLAKKLAISRSTLRQALNKLVYEGLLVRKKGVGTKVAGPQISSKSKNWLSFTQEMKARGIIVKDFKTTAKWVIPDEAIAGFFKIEPGTKILKLERLRGGQKEGAFVFFVSYFHPRIGLTIYDDFSRPLYDHLETNFSIVAYLSKEEISVKKATTQIAQQLNIPAGSSVLFRKRYVYDQAERPIEYNLGYYKADSFIYTVESYRE